jgi:alpha-tubulin suppressor-like RCC1 family protein/Tol biopolymer transport system component
VIRDASSRRRRAGSWPAVVAWLLLAAAPSTAQTTVFSESFDGRFPGNWVVGDPVNGGTPPITWGVSTVRAYSGSRSGFCAEDGSGTRAVYPNNFHSFMERRNVSLAGYASATLTFRAYVDTELDYDILSVIVRNASGTSTTILRTSGRNGRLGWQLRKLDLSAYAGQQGLAIQFRFDSNKLTTYAGVWLDDVVLTASGVATPVASTVSAGDYNTCLVTTAGGAQCWGRNDYGQVGNGEPEASRAIPDEVTGLTSGAAFTTVGTFHACALTTGGAVQCWGSNFHGQIGDGTRTDHSTPVVLTTAGLTSGVRSLSAGSRHTCAVTAAGAVLCWGWNDYGQLGDGTTTSRSSPTPVLGLTSGIAAVAGGAFASCALTTTGTVRCWGSGFGTTPVAISDLTSVTAIAVGDFACALAGGGVKCWGGAYGATPQTVTGLSGVTAIAAGGDHACAIAGGGLQCWGGNSSGQLGDGTRTFRSTPGAVSGLTSGVTAVAAGTLHTCAVVTGGAVKCFGANAENELGDGTGMQRHVPTATSGLAGRVTSLSANGMHTCARSAGGAAQCWGWNSSGQVGDGTRFDRSTPTTVSGLGTVVAAVTTGSNHSCALTTLGGVRCWGDNANGQLGDDTVTDRLTPVQVTGLIGGVAALVGGGGHTCALTTREGVLCWGLNTSGQLGNGSTTNRTVPTPVSGLSSGVVGLVAGYAHTCALTRAGATLCWGLNDFGQLGDGSTTARSTPTPVSGLSRGVAALAAGSRHTCAVTTSGALKCWGGNWQGQLGDATTGTRATPTQVSGLTIGVAAAEAGWEHTCALMASGAVACWGSNPYGEVGDGTTTDRWTPVAVSGFDSGAVRLAVGNYHSCATTKAGGVRCWGDDFRGQLGVGTKLVSTTPTGVYRFLGTVAVTGASPAQGSVEGGNEVTMTGSFFLQGASVSLGGTLAPVVRVLNTETLVATTPAHAAGAVDVVVTNPDGLSARLAGGFTYAPLLPTITAVMPPRGPTTGGTRVYITGTNLVGAAVTVGGVAATSVTVLDASNLTAVTPPGAAGARDVAVTTSAGAAALTAGFTYDASSKVGDLGAAPSEATLEPSLNGDGRYLAFTSSATTLVAADTNGVADVFVRDRATGRIVRVSVTSAGRQAEGASGQPSISASGRHVAFVSRAPNLVVGDTNGVADVFLHDRDADGNGVFDEPGGISTVRVSVSSRGAEANGASDQPDLGAEGRFVAFVSLASNLVRDTNDAADVFLHDVVTGETIRVSQATGNVEAKGPSRAPSLSAGGARVVFASDATNLVPGDGNGRRDVFLYDRASATTVRVSVDSATGGDANGDSDNPSIDDRGVTIAFQTLASNIVSLPATSLWQIVLVRLVEAATLNTDGTSRVAAGVVDIAAALKSLLSANADGEAGNASSTNPDVAGEGGAVAFDSTSSNLASDDTNGQADVFVSDVGSEGQASAPERVSNDASGDQALGASGSATTSGNGQVTGFESDAGLTSGTQGSTSTQVFVHGDQLLVTRIDPVVAEVRSTGGLVIEGGGFAADAQVFFGTEQLGGVYVESATRIVVAQLPYVTTPTVFDVTVRNQDGGSVTLPQAFRFTAGAPPTLTGVTPSSGPTAGGTAVTLTGTGFYAPVSVTFGDVAATDITVVSPTTVTVLTPAHAAGSVDVVAGGATLAGAFTYVTESPQPSAFTRYLAEGATSAFFDARLALLNPGVMDTTAVLTFSRAGRSGVQTSLTVPARTRRTVSPKDLAGLSTAEFSTRVDSNQLLVVDRTMSWDAANGYGAHAETAVTAPALTWYLAEGSTVGGFNLFYLLQNPNATAAEVLVRYLRPSGAPLEKTYALAPASRTNIWVNLEEFPGIGQALAHVDVSAVVEVTNGQPIIVERAMYLDMAGQNFGAGHESAGVTAPQTAWFLAEGATGPYFDLFVLLANPNDTAAQVEATYLLPDGSTLTKPYAVAGNTRFNIWVDYEDARLADTAVSTTIRSLNDVPVVVERAMWWPGTFSEWHEAHNSPGATVTGTTWAMAEGEVGGARAVETYVLLANTSSTAGTVKVTLLFEDGVADERTFTVAGNSRFNVDVGHEFPSASGKRFGAVVESLGATPAQIVVERAMYWNALGQRWAAGTNALATKIQ